MLPPSCIGQIPSCRLSIYLSLHPPLPLKAGNMNFYSSYGYTLFDPITDLMVQFMFETQILLSEIFSLAAWRMDRSSPPQAPLTKEDELRILADFQKGLSSTIPAVEVSADINVISPQRPWQLCAKEGDASARSVARSPRFLMTAVGTTPARSAQDIGIPRPANVNSRYVVMGMAARADCSSTNSTLV